MCVRFVIAILAVVTIFAADARAQEQSGFEGAIAEARAAMMRDPSAALELAEGAESFVQNPQRYAGQQQLAEAEWLQAEATTRLGRPVEAAEIAERALERLGSNPQPSKLFADLNVARGRIAMAMGEFDTAFISFSAGYEVFQGIGDTRSQAIVLQSLGSIYTAAGQYERSLDYFEDARARHSDPSLDLAALNNTANAHREIGDYDAALSEYRAALAIAEAMGSPVLEARILNNIAALHVQFEAFDEAEAALGDAYRRVEGAGTGEWIRFLQGVEAQISAGRGNYTAARDHLERTFEGIPLDRSPQNFAEFHEVGTEIYAALGQWEQALIHMRAFKRLDDEARNVAASANSALLGAEFEFAEQELQIQQLRGERLEQDLALASAQVRTNILASLIGAVVLIGFLIFGATRYRAEQARKRVLAEALYVDGETGLPSRRALEETLDELSAGGFEYYVIALELDRHVHLRSALGFAAFATLTKLIAERPQQGRAKTHVGLISPGVIGVLLNADELVTRSDDEVERELWSVAAHYKEPVVIDGVTIDLSVVVGTALNPVESHEANLTIKNAVIAIEQARSQLRKYAIYDESLFGNPAQNLALMSRMSTAMEAGHIKLHYQPKLDLRTNTFTTAEALMRWTDPEQGPIAPDSYIPFAEETGRIKELTLWSLKQAVMDQYALNKAGHDIKLAINISGAILTDTDFANKAAQLANQSRTGLIFEVTETAIMADIETALKTLHQWKQAGIILSIDDYGTGQSSLAYLKRIPASELKLDRTFVAEVIKSQRDRMLVKATVDLAHNLDITLTAEGVEDGETLAALQLMGCDLAQGYGLCRPCSVMELIGFLQRANDADAAHGPGDHFKLG